MRVAKFFMTVFLFVDILVVVENTSFQQAFKRSARMIRPFFWKVFAYLIIIVGISLFPEVIYQAGLNLFPNSASALQKIAAVLIMPYLMIAQVELFFNIRSRIKFELSSLEEEIDSAIRDE